MRIIWLLVAVAAAINIATHLALIVGLAFGPESLELNLPFVPLLQLHTTHHLRWMLGGQLVLDLGLAALLLTLFNRQRQEREQLSRGLAGSESRTRSVFEAAVDAILMIDEFGKIEAVNPATVRLFGYQASEMLGRNINMLMPEPYHSEHDHYLSEYLRTGRKKIIGIGREAVGLRKDGTEFPAYLSVSEIVRDGRRWFTGILRDISELSEARQKLATERNFISAVLDTAGAAVVVLDARGRIINFNRASQKISGYSFEEVYGRVIWDFLIPHEQVEAVRKNFNSLILGRIPEDYDSVWLNRNGQERLIQWSSTTLQSGSNESGHKADFVVGTGIDITEKRRNENELSLLSRKIIAIQEEERNRIASEIHDVIGQALIALKFMVDDVLYRLGAGTSRDADPEQNQVVVKGKLDEINTYINATVQQARDISHNLSPIALKKIGLSHAIRELVNSFRAGTNYRIELDLDDMDEFFRQRWEINIYRIIQESLTNIFKHAGATQIQIQARRIANSLVIKVKDNGVGMDRAEAVRGTPDGSDALPLAPGGIGQLIMQERAHLLGGRLKIVSKKNQGTEIILEIPG